MVDRGSGQEQRLVSYVGESGSKCEFDKAWAALSCYRGQQRRARRHEGHLQVRVHHWPLVGSDTHAVKMLHPCGNAGCQREALQPRHNSPWLGQQLSWSGAKTAAGSELSGEHGKPLVCELKPGGRCERRPCELGWPHLACAREWMESPFSHRGGRPQNSSTSA